MKNSAVWIQILDEVEETLRRTEAAAAEREQTLTAASDAEEAGKDDRPQNLERLEEQIKGWPAALQQAETEASAADAVLGAAEGSLQQWLSSAEALARRLAKWVKDEVS
jgi:chromosome segregation ATPase